MSLALSLVLVAILLLLALGAGLYAFQEVLLLYPRRLPAGHDFGLPDVHEVAIPVPGAVLSALHLRLPDPDGLVFFLHGNSGHAGDWIGDTQFYRAANVDVFVLDYRGFGKSSGRVRSEAQLRADVAAAWAWVAPQYAGRYRVMLGRSLGTALVAGLAAQLGLQPGAPAMPDRCILVSPYWSIRELARRFYPYAPGALLRYPLETWRDLPRVPVPVTLIHGDLDALIPLAHAQRLQALVPRAELVTITGAAHNDLQDFAQYLGALAARVRPSAV